MYRLQTFKAFHQDPSGSPFCTKIIALLHMIDAKWERVDIENPGKAPYGKLPVLIMPDGRVIPDSHLIENALLEEGHDLYPNLNKRDRASAHSLIALIEGNLLNCLVLDRWGDPRLWASTRDGLFGSIPKVPRQIVASLIRAKVLKSLKIKGYSTMSKAHRMAMLDTDLTQIAALLHGQKYLFGEQPCAADAALVAFLSPIDRLPVPTDAQRRVAQEPILQDYLKHARARLFPNSAIAHPNSDQV